MGGCHLKGKSEFLEICPVFLGSLEILISLVCIIISLWGDFFILFFCFSLFTGAVTISADKKETMCLPLWTVIVLVVCDILICILSAIVASTIGDKCCYCCRRMETTNPEETLVCTPSQDNVWRYDRNKPSVIVQNTVIVPESAAPPTVYSLVRYVLPSEHGQARLSYFEEH